MYKNDVVLCINIFLCLTNVINFDINLLISLIKQCYYYFYYIIFLIIFSSFVEIFIYVF